MQPHFPLYLFSRPAICSGGERKEYRVPQKVQVGLKTRYTKSSPKINRQAALDHCADQMAEGSCQRILLTAGLNLIKLHLEEKKGYLCKLSQHFNDSTS